MSFAPEQTDYGSGFMAMATSGYSADQIAELRARRILLNETHSGPGERVVQPMRDSMLEVLIRGLNTPLQVSSSPLLELFSRTGSDRESFLAAARPLLILYLRLSGVVEHVFH